MSETLDQRAQLVSKKYMGRRYVKVLVEFCRAELQGAAQLAHEYDLPFRDGCGTEIAKRIRERAR